MNVLWIYAHPEGASLAGALREEGVRALEDRGDRVEVSDLYAMKWKATVDADDFTGHDPGRRLRVGPASQHAYETATLSGDIRAEHDKLARADAVVVQFPLWWYGMPAILKGWFDRVFVQGFAYGVKDPRDPRRTLRYGEGRLAGKRALVIVTTGSPEPAIGPRGINGQLDQVLFPLLHGTLWYTGMSPLPPVGVYGANHLTPEEYDAAAALVRGRVTTMAQTEPIPYRTQNGGDYDRDLVLRPEVAPGTSGLGVHTAQP
ncbi:MAG TPA: NAD(P)H-dependent oxidoreductase [Nocardioidaceae bacterium]|nr:NAD(P)H-dependent oxidoreductase [Nocardioidaceae bacterium]